MVISIMRTLFGLALSTAQSLAKEIKFMSECVATKANDSESFRQKYAKKEFGVARRK